MLPAPVPVLVTFYAGESNLCRMLAPTLERQSAEFAGRDKVMKVQGSNRSGVRLLDFDSAIG